MKELLQKTFVHYSIPLDITDAIRQVFKSKLRRMGMQLKGCGSKSRLNKLSKWKDGRDSIWYFTFDKSRSIVNQQLLKQKLELEAKLNEEIVKRKSCEEEIHKLEKTNEQLATRQHVESDIVFEHQIPPTRKRARKPLAEVSRQQQYNRKKKIVSSVQNSLQFCEMEDFQPCLLELREKDSDDSMILDVHNGTLTPKLDKGGVTFASRTQSTLYVKDRYAISNSAYHELSTISDLPTFHKIRKLSTSLNSKFEIMNCPNGYKWCSTKH